MEAVLELLSSGVWLAVACSLEKKHDVAFVTKLAFDSAHAILVKVNPRIIQSLVRLFSIHRQYADPVCFFHLVVYRQAGSRLSTARVWAICPIQCRRLLATAGLQRTPKPFNEPNVRNTFVALRVPTNLELVTLCTVFP